MAALAVLYAITSRDISKTSDLICAEPIIFTIFMFTYIFHKCVAHRHCDTESTMDGNVTSNITDFGGDLQNETIQTLPVSPFLTTIKIIIGVTGLVGNVLVVVVFYKYKTLFQQVKSVYIVNQSFIDGLVSALLIAVSFVRILPRRR